MNLQMEKEEIRRIILEKRSKLTKKKVETASKAIIEIIKDLEAFRESRMILSYMPYGQEVDLLPLNQFILDNEKRLCLPRVRSSTEMDCAEVESLSENMIISKFRIMEPSPELKPSDLDSIDFVLVPGLAFDREGNRIGHGKGYYDRFLAQINKETFTLGIAYAFQVFDRIPSDPFDKKVKGIVSENQLFLNM